MNGNPSQRKISTYSDADWAGCRERKSTIGGAIAIDFAYHYPEAVETLILIDGQAYIDGVGSMSKLPKPLAKLGISVLKSPALRAYAGKLSYYRSEVFSTDDAMRIGRIHTLRDGWDDATLSYM